MRFFVLILAIIFACGRASAQHDHHNHEEHRVNVSVYYESLCPDSRKFFTQQLYPSLQGNLSKYVNLTLVPYGKTTYKMELSDLTFTCHHGPAECFGNKLQACAIKLIDQGQPSEGLGFNKKTAAFINCLMDKAQRNGDQATFPTKDCAEVNQVNNLFAIENCANHTDGSNYLSMLGKLTEAVQNPIKSVPTILFNDMYKEEDNMLANRNFVQALCRHIQGVKPAECSRSGASLLQFNVLCLAVAYFGRFFF